VVSGTARLSENRRTSNCQANGYTASTNAAATPAPAPKSRRARRNPSVTVTGASSTAWTAKTRSGDVPRTAYHNPTQDV